MSEQAVPIAAERSRRVVVLAIGAVGASATLVQLVLMRELVAAFSGNELVFGVSLACWLVLTGAGAWLGQFADPRRRRSPENLTALLAAGLVAIALLPIAELAAIRGLRDVVFLPGAAVGVTPTMLGCLAALAPFCLISGAMLTLGSRLLALAGDARAAGRVYTADTIGSIAGGLAFTLLVAWRCQPIPLLAAPAWLAVALAALLGWRSARYVVLAGSAGAAALLIALLASDAETRTIRWQQHDEIVFHGNSPYGRLVVTRAAGQLTFFDNGVPVIYSDNVGACEEAAHYVLAQRPPGGRILLIGGAVAGTAREALRHNPAEITAVELDPMLIVAGRALRPDNLADRRIRLVVDDGRRFVQRTAQRFDAVILDLPDPVTFQINRFFTAEFFADVKRVLAPDGVFGFGLARYENFVSEDLARVLACAHATLQTSFAQVTMIPGGRVFFVASDSAVHRDIAAALASRGIDAKLVNRDYLAAMLAADRLADLQRAIARPSAPNADFTPVLHDRLIRHWLGQFTAPQTGLVLALAVALASYVLWLPAVPRVIFASGFAAAALEIVLLLAFQVFYGALYQQIGLVVTLFMAGLAAGALWAGRRGATRNPARRAVALGFVVAALAAAFPVLLARIRDVDATFGGGLVGQIALLTLAFALAACVGAQFPLAGLAADDATMTLAPRLFSADLIGAAVGALLASAWLIPRLGVPLTCAITAALNVGASAVAWRQTRSP